ncbi:uncharacterized protein LOC105849091 isoform X2 [Hydra vulgaris]|uniref:uncharacterized protein LOC105849091 isoform X2 n=1 Tax=Hydra vulgaris TaxID=6087 RepID=UPI0001924920
MTSKIRLKSFQSGSKDIPNFKLLLDLKADALSVEDAEHSIENIRILYNDLKLTLQSLVYSVPPNIAVAVYNNHKWSFQTPLKAMDFSFKLIQVLNKEYNIASFPAWMFLQKYIYCFNCTDFDVSCPKASELASELNL